MAKVQTFSVDEQIEEYIRCKEDPYYFIENYIIIPEPGGYVNLKLYEVQRTYIDSILKTHSTITLKSRQLGISTITRALIVHAMIFNKGLECGVVSKDGPEATAFSRKTINMIENLPHWLSPGFKKKTEQTFILSNDSELNAATVSPAKPGNTLRGKPLTILVIDEAAFIGRVGIAMTGMAPAVTKAQTTAARKGVPYFTAIISTPNGMKGDGEWYFQNWNNSLKGINGYDPVALHWKDVKEFRDDPNWYETQCKKLNFNERTINQELELKFLGSQDALFSDSTIEILQEITQHIEPLETIKMIGGDLRIYEQYDPSKFYLFGIDVATESGTADSAITIHEYESMDQVAEYTGKLSVSKFQGVIENIWKLFPNSSVIIEWNSYGEKLTMDLWEKSIVSDHIYLTIKKDKDGKVVQIKPGLPTNTRTRPLYIDALYEHVKDCPETIRSKIMVNELISLEDVNGKIKSKGKDDLGMALSFCCFVRNNTPLGKLMNQNSFFDIGKDDLQQVLSIMSEKKPTPTSSQYGNFITDFNNFHNLEGKNKLGFEAGVDDYDDLNWIWNDD